MVQTVPRYSEQWYSTTAPFNMISKYSNYKEFRTFFAQGPGTSTVFSFSGIIAHKPIFVAAQHTHLEARRWGYHLLGFGKRGPLCPLLHQI